MQHTIAGIRAPLTRETSHVLAALQTLRACNSGMLPVPSLLPLLAEGLVLYHTEASGQDNYLTWWQVLETSSAVRRLLRKSGWTWSEILADKTKWAKILNALRKVPARADCEDLAGWGMTCAGARQRTWPVVQEFRTLGVITGWHAMYCAEVPENGRIVGEVPVYKGVYSWNFPVPCTAGPGRRIALVDAAFLAGMERPDLGVFQWR